jgi:hypothetical protein
MQSVKLKIQNVGQPFKVAINSRKVKTLPYIYPINQLTNYHLTKKKEVKCLVKEI